MLTNTQPRSPEPLRATLTDADDRIRLNHWMPPQQGFAPRIRIGQPLVQYALGAADRGRGAALPDCLGTKSARAPA